MSNRLRPSGIELILFTFIITAVTSVFALLIFYFKQIHRKKLWLLFFATFIPLVCFNTGVYFIYNMFKLNLFLYSFSLFIVFWLVTLLTVKTHYRKEGWLNENYWRGLNSFQFEKEIANLFREIGYKAKVTQQSVDYGVDVITYFKKGKIAVQCKRYNGHPATCSEVRDLWGAKDFYNCTGAIMVALDGITKNAETFINKFENYDFMTINDIIRIAEELQAERKDKIKPTRKVY